MRSAYKWVHISAECISYASYEMSGCIKHKLESRLPGEISVTSDMKTTQHMAESEQEKKNL